MSPGKSPPSWLPPAPVRALGLQLCVLPHAVMPLGPAGHRPESLNICSRTPESKLPGVPDPPPVIDTRNVTLSGGRLAPEDVAFQGS